MSQHRQDLTHLLEQSPSKYEIQPGKLAAKIIQWLTNELQYKPTVSVNELKKLCRGNMIHIWNFLINHIRSEKFAKLVKQNLIL